MDHLLVPMDQAYHVPYCSSKNSYDNKGFWGFPKRLGYDPETLDDFIRKGSLNSLLRARSSNDLGARSTVSEPANAGGSYARERASEIASLLQAWWFFGMLDEVLNCDPGDAASNSASDNFASSIQISDFLEECTSARGSKFTRLSTRRLAHYLSEWRTRLDRLPKQAAHDCLTKAMRCIEDVHQYVRRLGIIIEKNLVNVDEFDPSTYSPSQETKESWSVMVSLIKTRHSLNWKVLGRLVLSENMELSTCVLGNTLGVAALHMFGKMGFDKAPGMIRAWYTPPFLTRHLVQRGFCPRVVSRLDDTFNLLGNCYASTISPHPSDMNHSRCTVAECVADDIPRELYKRYHAKPECECKDVSMKSTAQRVNSILGGGGFPIIRIHDVSKIPADIEVIRAIPQIPFVAISHLWSDGIGHKTSNQLYKCQWERLQDLVNRSVPGRNGITYDGPIFFWIDTICVPRRAIPEDKVILDLRKRAIELMRETYYSSREVLVIDQTLTSLSSAVGTVELALRICFSRWNRRVWTFHEGAIATKLYFQLSDGICRIMHIFEQMVDILAKCDAPNSPQILSGLGLFEISAAWAYWIEARNYDNQAALIFSWNEIRARASKYSVDRYTVLASLLGLDTKKMLDDSLQDQERMEYLFTHLEQIPAGIIFNNGRRLDRYGLRWIPASLDECSMTNAEGKLATRTDRGVLVNFDGWTLQGHPHSQERFIREGLETRVSSVAKATDGESKFIAKLEETQGNSRLYLIEVHNEGQQPLTFPHDTKLAIVLCPPNNGTKRGRAILATIQDPDTNQPHVVNARWEVNLHWMRLMDHELDDVQKYQMLLGSLETIHAKRAHAGKETIWCIG